MAGKGKRAPAPARRNPLVRATRRLGHRVVPSAKVYTRKGRSAGKPDRPFGFSEWTVAICCPSGETH